MIVTMMIDFENYLVNKDLSKHTIKGYLDDVKNFARWFEEANGEDLTLENLTSIDLRQYHQALHESGAITQRLGEVKQAIIGLLDLAETFGALSAGQRLIEREAEQARLETELRSITARREAANVKITPEPLGLVLAAWRGEIKIARQAEDIRALKMFLSRFIERIELGYNFARIMYTYPIGALGGKGQGLSYLPLGSTCKVSHRTA